MCFMCSGDGTLRKYVMDDDAGGEKLEWSAGDNLLVLFIIDFCIN